MKKILNNFIFFVGKSVYFGQYIAMSIAQGGGGFPFLSEAVFFYMTTEECDGKYIKSDQLPNSTFDFVVNKVILNLCITFW